MKTILTALLASTLLIACTGLDEDSADPVLDGESDPGLDDSPTGDAIDSRLVGCWTFVQSTDTVFEEETVELGADGRFNHIWSISVHAPDLDGSQGEPQGQTEESSGTWSVSADTIEFVTDDGESDQVEFQFEPGAIVVEGRTYLGPEC